MFTKIMDQVLLGPGNTMSHIMNGLLLFSKTTEEQAEILQQVFDRIRYKMFYSLLFQQAVVAAPLLLTDCLPYCIP
jgi:hypothetical protein